MCEQPMQRVSLAFDSKKPFGSSSCHKSWEVEAHADSTLLTASSRLGPQPPFFCVSMALPPILSAHRYNSVLKFVSRLLDLARHPIAQAIRHLEY